MIAALAEVAAFVLVVTALSALICAHPHCPPWKDTD